jgi:hypothetical protein
MYPPSLLILSGCNFISIASFIMRSMYPFVLASLQVLLNSTLWPVSRACATADLSDCPSLRCRMCSLRLVSIVLFVWPIYVLPHSLDGSLGHTVYRKPMHTDLYLHAESAHHPAQKNWVLRTLVHRESIGEELQHLKKTFRKNGYSERDISHVLNSKRKQ